MKDSLSRILLALAGSNVARNELREFLTWVDANGIDSAVDIISSLKTAASNAEQELGRGLFADKSFETAQRLSEKQLVARIEKLMLESGLTKAAMTKITTELLKERGYSQKSIPDASKVAFRVWVERLLRQIPADEMLNIASIVRNHAAHGIDWPLRRERP
jgi:hypothetical protein